MATLSEYKTLIRFAIATKDINPNLYNDIKRGWIKPCKTLNEAIRRGI